MSSSSVTAARDALADRLFQATIATFDLYGVYLGGRLDLYRSLAERRPSTACDRCSSGPLC